jgi:uncharacterized phage protein gp47/JayE
MMFAKDFNEILDEILTNYRNIGPIEMVDVARLKQERPDIYEMYTVQGAPDTSEGTIIFMRAAGLASLVYGLRKLADKAVDQFFTDTASRQFLERHAADYGLTISDKTDIQLKEELSAIKKIRLMGGNKYDYIHWAKQVVVGDERVVEATVHPCAQGEGTFDIVIMSNKNLGVPSVSLIDAVEAKINENRTICSGFSWGMRVIGPQTIIIDISITGSGDRFDKAKTAQDIAVYLNSLKHAQTLYKSQLITIAIQNGADNAVVHSPLYDVVPIVNTATGMYEMIRPGTIEVL